MSDHLKDRLRSDLIAARKSRDKLRTVLLSTILSDVRNREIDTRSDLDSEGVQEVVSRAIKQRRDAEEQMDSGADCHDSRRGVDELGPGMRMGRNSEAGRQLQSE